MVSPVSEWGIAMVRLELVKPLVAQGRFVDAEAHLLKNVEQPAVLNDFYVRIALVSFYTQWLSPTQTTATTTRPASDCSNSSTTTTARKQTLAGPRDEFLDCEELMMLSTPCTRSAARVAVCILSLAALSAARADFGVQQNMAFTTKGQSPYGPGAAFTIFEPGLNILKKPLLLNAGPQIEINAWDAFLGGLLPTDLLPNIFSLEAGFGAKGTNNLDLGYYATGGRLDVTYPASSNLNFRTEQAERRVVANQQYSIGANFLPGVDQRTIPSEFWTTLGPGGPELWLTKRVKGDGGFTFQTGQPPPSISSPSFVVHSPYASAWLDSRIDLRVGAYVKIEALGGLIDEGVDFTFGASVGDRLAEIDPSGLYVAGAKVSDVSLTDPIPISVPIQGGSATLQLPRLGLASDSQQGDVIGGFDKQPVLRVQGNLEKLIPGVGQFLEGSVGPFGYKLVTVTGGPVVSLYQDMKFDPKPKVRLRFSEPVLVQGTQQGDVVVPNTTGPLIPTTLAQMPVEGGALNWLPMVSDSDKVVISPTYILENDFTTRVGLDLSVAGQVEALEVTHPFGSTGPLIRAGFDESLLQHDLFAKTFNVPINDVVAARVSIPKSNINLITGEDLKFSQFFFTSDQPPGAVKYDVEFTRKLPDGTTRTYLAPGVVGQQTSHSNGLPDPGEGNENYGVFAADNPIVVIDPVTGEQFNLGRYILNGTYDVSSLLPADSPNYSPQPNPDLPDFVEPVYANVVSASPEIPIDTTVDPYLKAYNDLAIDPTKFTKVGVPEVVDRRTGGSSQVIVRTGETNPDLDGEFDSLPRASQIDEQGVVYYFGAARPFAPGAERPFGIHRGDGGNTRSTLVRNGDLPPDSNRPINLGEADFVVNDAGQFALINAVDGSGLLRGDANGLVSLIRRDSAPPEGDGVVFDFRDLPVINNAGQAAVAARVRTSSGALDTAIYRADEQGVTKIARTGDILPGLTDTSVIGVSPAINDAGMVAFGAEGTAVGGLPSVGLFLGSGGPTTKIVLNGQPTKSGFSHDGYIDFAINSSSQVAFVGGVRDTGLVGVQTGVFRWDGGDDIEEIAVQGVTLTPQGTPIGNMYGATINDRGSVMFADDETQSIWLYRNDLLEQLVHPGDLLPQGDGAFAAMMGPGSTSALNDADHVAFTALVSDGASSRNGIYVHDGQRVVHVAHVGQPLAGGVIASLYVSDMNDRMQIAYNATLVDGREVIARFDPALYWKTPGGGQWETDANWSLGVDPAASYDAYIIAPQPLAVTGPTSDSEVRSLTLGGLQTAPAQLNLVAGTTLAVAEGVTLRENGVLAGTGVIDGDVVNQGGTISPGNSPGVLEIVGDFRQQLNGLLQLEIAGPEAGAQYDVLAVGGAVTLAGQIDIVLQDGYLPAPGTRFDLIRYEGAFDASAATFTIIGAPAGAQLMAFAQGGVFGIVYGVPEPSALSLAIVALTLVARRRHSATRARIRGVAGSSE